MKKLFLGIFIFAIVSILITGSLIFIKTNKNNKIDNLEIAEKTEELNDETEDINTNLNDVEKTLDLYGRYDENDLKIEEEIEWNDIFKKDIKIPVIKGLKNKDIENKINASIKEKIRNKLNGLSEKNLIDEDLSLYYEIQSNFSNVISITYYMGYSLNDEHISDYVTLNYELLTGNELKFEDLFTKDADLHTIARRIIYKTLSKSTNGGEFISGPIYDEKINEWVSGYWQWDETKLDYVEIKEPYIPFLTEHDINKIIKKFINNEEKVFYFTPSRIYIVIDKDAWYRDELEFKDIANEVVIYDKYLTRESLYEENNIGTKGIWTCSKPNNNEYLEFGFAEDNLYYEIVIKDYSYEEEEDTYPFNNSIKKLKENLIEESKNKIEEYKKLANKNKDKFYVVLIKPFVNQVYARETTNLVLTQLYENVGIANVKNKNEIWDKILECYRYYNLNFYESALDLAIVGSDFGGPSTVISWDNIENKIEEKTYDARTLREIKSIDEIFKNDTEYMEIIKNNLRLDLTNLGTIKPEEIDILVENATYTICEYGIRANVPGVENYFTISFRDLSKSLLKIYDLEVFYIISESSTRKLQTSEIQNLTLDELNKAYNEIFARHGHEFKNTELKVYFEGMSWYNKIENKTVSIEELNEIEKHNLEVIKSVISEKKK